MCESAGRNKGWEERDVVGCVGGELFSFSVSRDSAFCCEQRFSVHYCIGCEHVIFCGLLACCEQGTECSGL